MRVAGSDRMEYRTLGTSDLIVSRIGFGAWASGGGGWAFALGHQDDKESIEAIYRALDLGVNWIDTAPLYGIGHSEDVVRRALDGMAEPPYVFSKCGMPCEDSGRIIHCLTRESIRRECDASLKRLNVEAIDLYQVHWNKPSEEIEEGVAAVAELQREGKVRYIGVSNFDVDEMNAVRQIAEITTLQPPYSLLDRNVEAEILPYCGENNIGVLVYSPLQSGLLSGKMTRERIAAFAEDDIRRDKPEYSEPQLSYALELAETLKKIATRHGRSAAEVAIAWVLNNPNVDAAIVGMRRPEQAEGTVGAAELRLTDKDLVEIDEHLRNDQINTNRLAPNKEIAP